ncbi:hypothetical protein G8C92_18965 [Paenibacillus donghaensis]|uniref:hypothetical protein n=1 Tax=Paenibacillus donghaensis TaxID=414771 RepID=UPI001884460B|nr:hypothetical protein [Paenibacillus donghaensis]MBE9916101.1 hypothetical protein [Paenibacillus donghaensis]
MLFLLLQSKRACFQTKITYFTQAVPSAISFWSRRQAHLGRMLKMAYLRFAEGSLFWVVSGVIAGPRGINPSAAAAFRQQIRNHRVTRIRHHEHEGSFRTLSFYSFLKGYILRNFCVVSRLVP